LGQGVLALGFLILGARAGPPSRETVKRLIVPAAVLVMALAAYQVPARAFDLPGAWLPITNAQISGDEGFQRGFTRAMEGDTFTRASSFFPEPSDLGRFSAWLGLLGLLGPTRKSAAGAVLIGLGVLGVVLSQSVGGLVALGAGVGLAALFGSRRVSFGGGLIRVIGVLLVLGTAVLVAAQFELLTPLVERLAGIASGDTDLARTQRFADLAVVTVAAMEYPLLGLGLGAVGDLPGSPLVSIGYLVLILERGLIGTLLFVGALLWIGFNGMRGRARAERLGFVSSWSMLELVLLINFAMIYFPTLYFAVGVGLRAVSDYARAGRAEG
ncbi:MAG TPA: hypothetical protein VK858_03980, partial [Longimicrobiales bacterium]|nr:hypothetical protein [Longimicrobiales bacterium]